jgi:hypothetical protein
MGRMKDLDIEIKGMRTEDLLRAYLALRECRSKGVLDEYRQELYAQELDIRDHNQLEY